ncbi:MAG: hypothetical protein V3T86_15255, partial [Planctomycetota bacterium]
MNELKTASHTNSDAMAAAWCGFKAGLATSFVVAAYSGRDVSRPDKCGQKNGGKGRGGQNGHPSKERMVGIRYRVHQLASRLTPGTSMFCPITPP